ncbi:MAG: beta-propeller fold lactonase family protein [Terracidiphilus sp.]|jgi:6-phosphogluconolactonase (cycloisomerase 2 family)
MKFSKLSQLFLVSTTGLLLASLLTSCEISTIDYVFVADSAGSGTGAAGQIETYAADSETGALRAGPAPVPSGGVNPVALAVTSNYENLYVANQGDSSTAPTVVHFDIATNGVLSAKETASFSTVLTPVALAVNTAGTDLFVAYNGSGANLSQLVTFPLSSGALGSSTGAGDVTLAIPGYPSDTIVPTGVNVLANGSAVYVTGYDQSAYNPGGSITSTANPGWVWGYTVGSGGALTPVSGSPWKAGIKPTSITSDPANRFVYITDFASNEVIGYIVQSTSVLDFMVSGPYKTGNEPQAVTVDPRGLFVYIVNSLDSTVSAYDITLTTGAPSAAVSVTGTTANSTDTTPVAIVVDPSLGRFVYTANLQGNSVSGFKLNPTTGVLTPTVSTPYPTGFKPTAVASVPHGGHAIETISP